MKRLLFFFIAILSISTWAQGPEVTSWVINTDGSTGYNNLPSNVQLVQYSDSWVYVSCSCIPGYDIGPWTNNPNTPANQNFVFKITRDPQSNAGTLVETPLGHIGVWTNGVSAFNASDAMSYNNQGIWNRNAIVAEAISFDDCLGHPAPNGEYHTHLNPTCLYEDDNPNSHSPIIGYAFDGFPIYGAYGFANVDGTGGISRMESSYQIRNMTARTTLPDGTVLNANQYGPAINATYPLGLYLEDFEFIEGLGDLDEHNGRWCITPEYPEGIYAYFVTIDENLEAVYPYTIGPTYYGTVPSGNTGPQSGHNTINEPVEEYTPAGISVVNAPLTGYPNPADDFIVLTFDETAVLKVFDIAGKEVAWQKVYPGPVRIEVEAWTSGYYTIHAIFDNRIQVGHWVIQ